MEMKKLTISKSQLFLIPEDERLYWIFTMIVLNDLNTLLRCVSLSYPDKKSNNEIIKKSQTSQTIFFLETLSGKLLEAWNLIEHRLFNNINKNELSQDGKNALHNIEQYFTDDENLLTHIRNKLAFHYDVGKVNKFINEMKNDDSIELIFHKKAINCKYFINEAVIESIICSFLQYPKENAYCAWEKLISEIHKITNCFIIVLNELLLVIIKKYLKLESTDIEIPDPPEIVTMPSFLK